MLLQDFFPSIIKCHVLKSKAYFTYNASLLKTAVRRYDFDEICLRYLRKCKKRDVLCFFILRGYPHMEAVSAMYEVHFPIVLYSVYEIEIRLNTYMGRIHFFFIMHTICCSVEQRLYFVESEGPIFSVFIIIISMLFFLVMNLSFSVAGHQTQLSYNKDFGYLSIQLTKHCR